MTEAETSLEAFREVREAGEDVSVRLKVLAAIAEEPRTTRELVDALPHSANAIRPRVNELLLMECVERDGKRTNPSGHEAYVHHITDRGRLYLAGEVEPEMPPRLSELKDRVVSISRSVISGEADLDVLHLAVESHDEAKRRMDPEWDGR